MTKNAQQLILTAQPEAMAAAFGEIQRLDSGARLVQTINQALRLLRIPNGYYALTEAIRLTPLIFARHIFPVQFEGEIDAANSGYEENIDSLLNSLSDSLRHDPSNSLCSGAFSVQMRVFPKDEPLYKYALTITQRIEALLTEHGFIKDDKNCQWVVSLLFHQNKYYAGVSRCQDNLSYWNGGAMRLKKDAAFISRAEFKLWEALETFGYKPPVSDVSPCALDLGASPGGWTKTLLDLGFHVTAVDPAALDERLAAHPKLTHFRGAAQFFKSGAPYDLIVNDMRMDMFDSCRVMCNFSSLLKPCGAGIMTLKLPQGHWYQKTMKAVAILEKDYAIKGKRQLFHNRDEVTVYLSSRPRGLGQA